MSTNEDKCDTPDQCDWYTIRNWEGDPSVPNGTHSWLEYVCRTCKAVTGNKPEDYQEDDENDLY